MAPPTTGTSLLLNPCKVSRPVTKPSSTVRVGKERQLADMKWSMIDYDNVVLATDSLCRGRGE